jgi:hypothetical protein
VRCEANRDFRNIQRKYLKEKVDDDLETNGTKISEIYIGA